MKKKLKGMPCLISRKKSVWFALAIKVTKTIRKNKLKMEDKISKDQLRSEFDYKKNLNETFWKNVSNRKGQLGRERIRFWKRWKMTIYKNKKNLWKND